MAYTKNTWVTDDIITADKLNNLETGVSNSFISRATFTDWNAVANNMTAYDGKYYTQLQVIANGPTTGSNSTIEVISMGSNSGTLIIRPTGNNGFYYSSVLNGVISGWVKLSNDAEVFKLTGDQTASGNKSFTGNVSIAGSVMNYATIPSVSITGYVSGSLKVSKQSGMVSITSMDLVLTKGATVTLPAGYYPRTQLQAPITGQNTTGTTAGGYMTVGVDGSVTFNSMGFASGNATAYVNVHYIAQV